MLASRSDARSAGKSDNWRNHPTDVQRRCIQLWFWAIAAVTLAIVAVGGITRLTQSGLSIVDWQPVIGTLPPMNEAQWTEAFDRYRQFPEYRQLRHGMTLADFKVIFFWEYLHRLLARLMGVVFLIPFVFFWRAGYLPRPLAWRALGLFGLGAMPGIMGWLMVSSGLVDLRVRRIAADRSTRRQNLTLLLLIASQYLLGVLTLIFRVPTAVAVLHQVMAGMIVAVWVTWLHDAVAQR